MAKGPRHRDLRASLRSICLLMEARLQGGRVAIPDDFSLMCILFLSKQLDHAAAILRLGDHPDTALIARSMLEGLCQLRWAQKDPSAKALRWRAFAAVAQWRTARIGERAGTEWAPGLRREMEEALATVGIQFLKSRERRSKSEAGTLRADPYVENWTGQQVRQIFEAVGALDHYEWTYRSFSDWHHWSSAGLLRTIDGVGAAVGYDPRRMLHEQAGLLVTTFQCLLETSQIADSHLSLGLEARLQEEYARFMRVADRNRARTIAALNKVGNNAG